MSITSNRHRDYNGRGHRGPVARVQSGVMPIKTGVSTENAEYISSCADHTTKEQLVMSARVNVNTPAAAPVTASAYIEKYCASDIYICNGQEQAGQYSYNYKTEDLVKTSATASALAKHGRAASYDRIASWGIVAL